MNIKPLTRNVTRAYRAADLHMTRQGREWYARARRLAEELDPENPRRAAAIIAVLSPQLAWSKNVELARQVYSDAIRHSVRGIFATAKDLPCLQKNARKAVMIMHGADPETVVRGPKVTAFWHIIAEPTRDDAVVCDRHAVDVALGRVTDDDTRNAILGRKGGYDAVAETYVRAARILSAETGETITPSEVQAVTWTYWRRTHAHHMAKAYDRREQAAA